MGPAFTRRYNTLLVTGSTAIRIPMVKRGVVDFAVSADWTPSAGDVKINIDGAGPGNVTNLPTAVTSGNTAYWEFILTAAELSCKQAIITVSDSATKAVEDNAFLVETFGHASAMYQADLAAANLPADVQKWLGGTIPAVNVTGVPITDLKYILGTVLTETSGQIAAAFKKFFDNATPTGTINSLPDAVAGASSGVALVGSNMGTVSSVTGAVGSVAGFTSSDVGAIKTQTDKLTFTVPNQIDANVLAWKSSTAPAMTGDAFARLGAAGAGLTALGDTRIAHLDADISAVVSAIAALHNLSTSDVLTQVAAALTATVADSVPADGTRPSIASGIYMLVQFMLERSVTDTTMTINKPDGTTALLTLTLNSATAPTAVTRAT